MPELPEVETLRRGLAARITGMRITAFEVLDRKIFDGPGDAIKQEVVDHQISRVTRRGKVSQAEARRLHAANKDILRPADDSGGTIFAGYVNEARGRPGYLGQVHVFRRQGLPCQVCGTPIIRSTIAGRATNYCPHCQQR